MKTNKVLLSGLAAGFALMSTQAIAGGSIGGDCCADLEERVAELEASTVRKGNRKVSLKLSGHVNKAIVFSEDDTKIIDNSAISGSRFRLTGKAKITSDLYAGYAMEFSVAAEAGDPNIALGLRKNEMYLGSKTLGKLSIGQGSTASDGIAEIDLSGTTNAEYTSNNAGFISLDGFSRKERVRYDSPTLAGFKISASWQDNDDTDIALRFASSLGDFKLAAGIAMFSDDSAGTDAVAGSISALHVPTGLNVTFAAGDDDADENYWYVKAGIKQKVFAAGETAISVSYHEQEISGITDEKISFQFEQDIDAAATTLYANVHTVDSEDEAVFIVGSRINF